MALYTVDLDSIQEASAKLVRGRALARLEKQEAKRVARFFVKQGRVLVRRLRPLAARFDANAVAEVLGEGDWFTIIDAVLLEMSSELEPLIRRLHKRGLKAGGEATMQMIGAAIRFELTNPDAVAYASARAGAQITRIDATTRQRVNKLLVDAVENNWGWNKTAEKLIEQFNDFAGPPLFPSKKFTSRAEMIAAYEIGDAYEYGSNLAARIAQGAGLALEKHWLNAGDGKVRPAHVANTGDGWVPMEHVFSGDGAERPPTDPGCRCTLIYRQAGSRGLEDFA